MENLLKQILSELKSLKETQQEMQVDIKGLKETQQEMQVDIKGLKESQQEMQFDIKSLKQGQNETNERLTRIETKLDDFEPKNATRHTEILNKIDTLSKDLAVVEAVTGRNMTDIAILKLVK